MIELIPMEAQHVAQVAELEKICFSDPWSQRSIGEELSNPLSCWLVCVENDTVLGYVGSQTVMDESDMMNVAVLPSARRRGIAEKLIRSLIDALAARGSRCLLLEVRASNNPAIRLYEKLGFSLVGRRKNYYYNPKEDALILRKEWEL